MRIGIVKNFSFSVFAVKQEEWREKIKFRDRMHKIVGIINECITKINMLNRAEFESCGNALRDVLRKIKLITLRCYVLMNFFHLSDKFSKIRNFHKN